MVGRLVSGSSSVPALLYFHIVVLVALVVADDALPQFLYPGGCFAAVVMLFGGCFATVSCFVLTLHWHLSISSVQVQLFG